MAKRAPGRATAPARSEWITEAPGVRSRAMVDEQGAALRMYRMEPGLRFSMHQHAFPEFGVLLSGEGRILFESGSRDVRAGDSFYLAPGTLHGFESLPAGEEVVFLNAEFRDVPPARGSTSKKPEASLVGSTGPPDSSRPSGTSRRRS